MRPTRPPDERRARHEATGEWPQPSLSAMLAERARRTPARVYLTEGPRRGARRAARPARPEQRHVPPGRAARGRGTRAREGVRERAPTPLPPNPHGPHDGSMLFYTSGTTADPQGVQHTPSTLGAVIRFQA